MVYRKNGIGTFVGKKDISYGYVVMLLPFLQFENFMYEIYEQTQKACLENSIALILITTGTEPEHICMSINMIDPANLLGVVFVPLGKDTRSLNRDILSLIRRKTRNIILLDNPLEGASDCSFIGNENIGSSFKLTERLISDGYGKYLCIPRQKSSVVNERIKGFGNAMSSYAVPEERFHIMDPDSDWDGVENSIEEALRNHNSVGIYAINDGTAMTLYHKFSKKYRIPEQIGLAGFGGFRLLSGLPLTTAAMDFPAYGKKIVQIMKSSKKQTIILPPEIIRGETT